MMETKIRCSCGCPNTLYITINPPEDSMDMLMIGSEKSARKSFKHFQGVWVRKEELIEILTNKSDSIKINTMVKN